MPVPAAAVVPSNVPPPPSPLTLPALPENLLEIHLSSPIMSPAVLPFSASPPEPPHFSIVDFPVGRFELRPPCEKRVWTVSHEDERRLSKVHPSKSLGEPPTRSMIGLGCLVYRLRCIEVRSSVGKSALANDSEWSMKESIWPKNIFIEVNGMRVEIRRKERWGKDLPADITNFIRAGSNTLTIVRLGDGAEESTFVAGIELSECCTGVGIKSQIFKERYLPPAQSRAEIMRRLSTHTDDNDIIVSTNTVTIDVQCPFSFKLIGTPVRGRACRHLECFDFDNYMGSRHREQPALPPRDDAYKCPHCGDRARPEHLIVDGFLHDVLRTMRELPMTYEDVKSIIVDENGAWKAKREKEKDSEERRKDSVTRAMYELAVPTVGKLEKDIEVICIDDD